MVLPCVRVRFLFPSLKLGVLCFVGEKMEGRGKETFCLEFVLSWVWVYDLLSCHFPHQAK